MGGMNNQDAYYMWYRLTYVWTGGGVQSLIENGNNLAAGWTSLDLPRSHPPSSLPPRTFLDFRKGKGCG